VALAIFTRLQLLAGDVKIDPNLGAGPGGPTAERLVNWLAALMLLGCAVGALFGLASGSS